MSGLEVWRVIVLLIGAFDIFYSTFILLGVILGKVRVETYKRRAHVTAIAASYIVLALATWCVIAGRALRSDPVSWPLPLASVGFPLGLYALWQLTRR